MTSIKKEPKFVVATLSDIDETIRVEDSSKDKFFSQTIAPGLQRRSERIDQGLIDDLMVGVDNGQGVLAVTGVVRGDAFLQNPY